MLVEVWREVGQHSDIATAAERIAALLEGVLPARALVVRRLDVARLRLETVAAGGADPEAGSPRARVDLTRRQLADLLGWCRAGRVLHGRAGRGGPLLPLLAPMEARGDVIAGPLVVEGEVAGVLVVVGGPGGLGEEHAALVQELLEPFSVALGNDIRLHEMSRLREALEADKQALLSRLARQEITEAVVGSEGGLQSVMERVQQVAATEVPVLLLGETGTGKEVIAREIHRHSPRAAAAVVRVNCGAIPPGLIDSELFGHERGSFTGAVATRAGWFERADGGTLFLDEIGELPPEAQVRLLRVLQDGVIERVGAHRPLRVDVRVVAATHRDLAAMVAEGTFREDLWYRIAVFPIRIPPLRDRREDVPALAAHFAWRTGQRLGGAPLVPTAADLALLTAYSWPGNVRELAAVIERAGILGGGHTLEIAAALGVAPLPSSAPASVPISPPPADAFPTLDEAMAAHIERALATTRGRIEGASGAAALLGINPHTLRARMRKLRVDWSRHRA